MTSRTGLSFASLAFALCLVACGGAGGVPQDPSASFTPAGNPADPSTGCTARCCGDDCNEIPEGPGSGDPQPTGPSGPSQGCEANNSCPAPARCGDGVIQAALGETCDDGNEASGDGCRADCVSEESAGRGFTGGQCTSDSDCTVPGSECVAGIGGGTCVVGCSGTASSGYSCADAPTGGPTTLCVERAAFEARAQRSSDLSSAGVCVATCDYAAFPATGCRSGLFCERRSRPNQTKTDEVCMPGDWTAGLDVTQQQVRGVGSQARGPAGEPYASLLSQACDGRFAAVGAPAFFGMANTLLAMDTAGRTRMFERLCAAPAELPTFYGIKNAAAEKRGFVLRGTRDEVTSWIAIAAYGSVTARDELVEGPLFDSRTMLLVNDSASKRYIYVDDVADHPSYRPHRGRYFGWINGTEWTSLDTELEPNVEFHAARIHAPPRFVRQWARTETIRFVADLLRAHLQHSGYPLGVGDLSLPAGGDMSGHASHKTGMDADLYWLTFSRDTNGPVLASEKLWVSQCTQSNTWECSYFDQWSSQSESMVSPSLPQPVAAMVRAMAQDLYDEPARHGIKSTWFVHHDVQVLAPFRALPSDTNGDGVRDVPRFVDDSNDESSGWPSHDNHVHLRFSF